MRGEGATGKRGSRSSPGPLTHCRGGGDLLRHNLQGVDHRDVAQPLSDGQGRVAILERGVGGGGRREGERGKGRERMEPVSSPPQKPAPPPMPGVVEEITRFHHHI